MLGLASALVTRLGGDGVRRGYLSVPLGSCDQFQPWADNCRLARLEILEGAENNLPDQNSLKAAEKIVELVSSLTSRDPVIVLVSGGGSALLPLPLSGITLQEKLKVRKKFIPGLISIS